MAPLSVEVGLDGLDLLGDDHLVVLHEVHVVVPQRRHPPHLLDVLLGPGGQDLVLGVGPAKGLQHFGSLLVKLVVALIRLSDFVDSLGG